MDGELAELKEIHDAQRTELQAKLDKLNEEAAQKEDEPEVAAVKDKIKKVDNEIQILREDIDQMRQGAECIHESVDDYAF